ncbi:RNA-binding S4 domain-containing protein [Bhargavaea cecembensis]|uniref:RNA-binding S4 domain-containing protein n=1 Tax=Bhargavaea cecembensis TaxID=394098 RepID=UPI00058B3C8C|nr:RNA-binding S4 domain-containing protein [Bhargavaea cecembensis]
MRLDKFMKVSRLIKRRTLAKEVADQGRITVNGKKAKASTDVKAGDELVIRFGQKLVTARIEELKDSVKKEDAARMFTVLKEEKLEKVEPEFIDDED